MRRWQTTGANLENADALLSYLRAQENPSDSVALRLKQKDTLQRLCEVLTARKEERELLEGMREERAQFSKKIEAAKILKTNLEAERLKLLIDRERGLLISRAEVYEAGVRIGAALSAECQELVNDLPGMLAGLDEAGIRERLQPRLDSMLLSFKAQLQR